MLYQVELLTRNKIEHQSRIIAKKSKPVQIEARQLWLSRVQVSSIVPTCVFFPLVFILVTFYRNINSMQAIRLIRARQFTTVSNAM